MCVTACGGGGEPEADGGPADGGGMVDAGPNDADVPDAMLVDGAVVDAAAMDANVPDAATDAGPPLPEFAISYLRATETGRDIEPSASTLSVHTEDGAVDVAATGEVSDVAQAEWSPDGTRFAFLSDHLEDGVYELFTVPAAGGTPTRVSGPISGPGDVVSFAWAPDGSRIAYLGDVTVPTQLELFTVAFDGTGLERVHGDLPDDAADVNAFAWSPDSSMLAFIGDVLSAFDDELFVASIPGGVPLRLNPALDAGEDVQAMAWNAGSTMLAYRADQDTPSTDELFVVAVTGGPATKISGSIVTGGDVDEFAWAGSDVVFRADRLTDQEFEVFRVSASGGAVTLVGEDASAGEDAMEFAVQPGGGQVAIIADFTVDEKFELYIDNGSMVQASSGTLGASEDIIDLAWSPANNEVAYRRWTGTRYELWVSAFGGTPRRVSSTDDVSDIYGWSFDGGHLGYVTEDGVGKTVTRLAASLSVFNGTLLGDAGVVDFRWSPTSTQTAYIADEEAAGRFQLLVAGTAIAAMPITGGRAVDAAWAPDGSKLAFLSDHETPGVVELFVRTTDGTVTKLSGSVAVDRDITDFEWADDSDHIAFRSDRNTDEVYEVFTVSVSMGATSITLANGGLVSGGNVLEFHFVPGSTDVIYRADALVDETPELFRSSMGMVSKISEDGHQVLAGFVVNASRVAYVNEEGTVDRLFVLDLPAGTPVSRLEVVTSGARTFEALALSPDGNGIAALVDHVDGTARSQVHAIAFSNPTVIQRVNEPLVAGGDVLAFAWSPDSSRITYVADQSVDGEFNLYVTLVSSGSASRVSPASPAGDVLPNIQWAPGSDLIFYIGRIRSASREELFAVEPDGSNHRVVNRDPLTGGDVEGFAISPDGSLILYVDTERGSRLQSLRLVDTARDLIFDLTAHTSFSTFSHLAFRPDPG